MATDAEECACPTRCSPVTARRPPRTLLDILDATIARSFPTRPPSTTPASVLTYARAPVSRSSAWPRELLAPPASAAATGSGSAAPSGTHDLYVAILGILRAGAAYVPVDADDPQERADLVFGEAAGGRGRRARPLSHAPSRRPGARHAHRPAPATPEHARVDRAAPQPSEPRRRRVGDLHVGLDRRAQGRRRHPPLRRGLRRRRVADLPAGRPDRARRPRARRALGGLRRLVRGDVAGLAPRRLPRACAARARPHRHGPRPVAHRRRASPSSRRCRPSRRSGRRRRSSRSACSSSAARPARPSSPSAWPRRTARCGTPTAPPRPRSSPVRRPLDGRRPVRIGLPLDGWDLAVVEPDEPAGRRRGDRAAHHRGRRAGPLPRPGQGRREVRRRCRPSAGSGPTARGDLVVNDPDGPRLRRAGRRAGQARRSADRARRGRRRPPGACPASRARRPPSRRPAPGRRCSSATSCPTSADAFDRDARSPGCATSCPPRSSRCSPTVDDAARPGPPARWTATPCPGRCPARAHGRRRTRR